MCAACSRRFLASADALSGGYEPTASLAFAATSAPPSLRWLEMRKSETLLVTFLSRKLSCRTKSFLRSKRPRRRWCRDGVDPRFRPENIGANRVCMRQPSLGVHRWCRHQENTDRDTGFSAPGAEGSRPRHSGSPPPLLRSSILEARPDLAMMPLASNLAGLLLGAGRLGPDSASA